MRLEQIPLFLGVLVAILGLGLLLDAQLPDRSVARRERRRRQRRERHRGGEALIGLGVMAGAGALIGRDTWRFGTVAVLVGVALLAAGGWLNREYLRELLLFRGAARRGEKRSVPRDDDADRTRWPHHAVVGPSAPVVPGIADQAPPREPAGLRGDREAPIVTAVDRAHVGDRSRGEDTPPDEHPRLRIR